MTPVAVIALQEVKNGLRNRWVLAATLLLAVLALSLTLLGSAPTGAVKVSELTVTVVSLASLTVFLVPLIALLLAYDAMSARPSAHVAALLAYPVALHLFLLVALTALSAVSLEGLPGECLALVGHNGAGKTTLMKLLLGLVRPSEGTVQTLGADPASAAGDQARFQLGFLPETIAFDAAMTGGEVLAFYARLKRLAPSAAQPLIERVGLAAAAGRRVGTYSKGMRQRLGLAQALLGRPRLLLLDEPTTGLDPELRRSFYELISELTSEGVTVLLSSHALSEMEARTDRVAILERGRLIACGSLAALRRQARLPVRVRITVPLCQTGRVAERLGHGLALERLDERTLVVACPSERKMELLRTLGELGAQIEDVDIVPPALDQLYGHFLTQGTPA